MKITHLTYSQTCLLEEAHVGTHEGPTPIAWEAIDMGSTHGDTSSSNWTRLVDQLRSMARTARGQLAYAKPGTDSVRSSALEDRAKQCDRLGDIIQTAMKTGLNTVNAVEVEPA